MEINITKINLNPNAGGGNSGGGGSKKSDYYEENNVIYLTMEALEKECYEPKYAKNGWGEYCYFTNELIWYNSDNDYIGVPQYTYNVDNQQWDYALDAGGEPIYAKTNFVIDNTLQKNNVSLNIYDTEQNDWVPITSYFNSIPLFNQTGVYNKLMKQPKYDINDESSYIEVNFGYEVGPEYQDNETYEYKYEIEGFNGDIFNKAAIIAKPNKQGIGTSFTTKEHWHSFIYLNDGYFDPFGAYGSKIIEFDNFKILPKKKGEELKLNLSTRSTSSYYKWIINAPCEFENISITASTQQYMPGFDRLNKIKGLHFSNIYVEEVNSVQSDILDRLFEGDTALEWVKIDNCNYPAVYLIYTFADCKSLKEIPQLNTGKIKKLKYTFSNCYSITDLSPIANWDTSECTDFSGCFVYCKNITDLSPIANWDTSKCEDMYRMLSDCPLIQSIPSINCSSIKNKNRYPLWEGNQDNKTLTDIGGFIDMKMSWDDNYGLKKFPNLTYQSCINILNGLFDFSGTTVGANQGILKVHQNFLDLVGDEIAIGTAKGWTITV